MTALSPPWPGAVGVSGGGDSVALMKLLKRSLDPKNLLNRGKVVTEP